MALNGLSRTTLSLPRRLSGLSISALKANGWCAPLAKPGPIHRVGACQESLLCAIRGGVPLRRGAGAAHGPAGRRLVIALQLAATARSSPGQMSAGGLGKGERAESCPRAEGRAAYGRATRANRVSCFLSVFAPFPAGLAGAPGNCREPYITGNILDRLPLDTIRC